MMRAAKTWGGPFLSILLLVIGVGCGGKANETSAASDGTIGPGDAPPRGEVPQPEPQIAELVWWKPLAYYGMEGTGFLGVSPDSSRVGIGGGGLSVITQLYREYSVLDGTVSVAPNETSPLSRDLEWSRELRAAVNLEVIDLRDGRVLRSLGANEYGLGGVLSRDGLWVMLVRCAAGSLSVERYEVGNENGESVASSAASTAIAFGTPSPITGYACGIWPPVMDMSPDGDTAVVGDAVTGELVVIDFERRSSTRFSAHARLDFTASSMPPAKRNLSGAILSLSLSPSGHKLATVGGDGALRLWSYPELEALSPAHSVAWSNEYTNCYTGPRSFAPVAWSPDEQLLATPGEQGGTVIRRAADTEVVTRIETIPTRVTCRSPSDTETHGPAILSFAPGGDGLAVFSEGSMAYYRLPSPRE